jgi:hypothetical protein
MREKCEEYLKKPTKKLRAELTTMEQNWCDLKLKDKPEAKPEAKPK